GGIAGAAGDLGVAIPALGRFAYVVEIFVDWQHRRLRGRHGALFLVQGIAGDADGHTDSFLGSARTVGSSREDRISNEMCSVGRHGVFSYALRVIWFAASRVAAKTVG